MRKNYVIDRTFQYRLVGTFLLSVIVALACFSTGAVLYYWISTMAGDNLFKEFFEISKQVYVTQEDESGNVERVSKTKTIYGVKRWEIIVPPILLNNLFILVVLSVIGIFYSHKIAGPIYRINREIQRFLDGETDVQIAIRKHDKLGDLVSRVNRVLSEFQSLKADFETKNH